MIGAFEGRHNNRPLGTIDQMGTMARGWEGCDIRFFGWDHRSTQSGRGIGRHCRERKCLSHCPVRRTLIVPERTSDGISFTEEHRRNDCINLLLKKGIIYLCPPARIPIGGSCYCKRFYPTSLNRGVA